MLHLVTKRSIHLLHSTTVVTAVTARKQANKLLETMMVRFVGWLNWLLDGWMKWIEMMILVDIASDLYTHNIAASPGTREWPEWSPIQFDCVQPLGEPYH